jgi:hypothetical protein
MRYAELRGVCEEFRTLLRETTSRELVVGVSVGEPSEPQDELHFLKLVSWSYVFLFESAQPAVRHVLSLLRTADPNRHKSVSAILETVHNLRTVNFHNLSSGSRGDDYKKRQVDIWLLQNGGSPRDWSQCCESLCAQIISAVACLTEKWRQLTSKPEDATPAIESLITAIDREWAPHTFDRMAEAAALNIGLQGLDVVKYRQNRLDHWRELVGFFQTREEAEIALKAAILRELERTFGTGASLEVQSGSRA